jgi:hypothetical protein
MEIISCVTTQSYIRFEIQKTRQRDNTDFCSYPNKAGNWVKSVFSLFLCGKKCVIWQTHMNPVYLIYSSLQRHSDSRKCIRSLVGISVSSYRLEMGKVCDNLLQFLKSLLKQGVGDHIAFSLFRNLWLFSTFQLSLHKGIFSLLL